jgi:hypothetical protein
MKEIDFRPKACTCIGVKFRKRKNFFIKHNILRYINTPGSYIKTLESLMEVTILGKHNVWIDIQVCENYMGAN